MARSRFRRLTLGVCVLAALVAYLWPPKTPAGPAAVTRVAASSAVSTPATATSSPTPVRPRVPTVTTPATSASPEPDRRPPSPVSNLTLAGNSAETFTVAWQPVAEAATYEVVVNGLAVATTAGTEATLGWPGDAENIQIQVAALDESANRSEWRTIVIIPPPMFGASESMTPSLSPFPTETPSPTPTFSPTPTPTLAPTPTPPGTPPAEEMSATTLPTTTSTSSTGETPITAISTPAPSQGSSTPDV